ncbi:hypothetical protein PTSG_07515 [Salpingoeca rosetta]|uniref:Ion transport domain-containing protein n=1 Tax=Salpingoeca rosetta (strain ATCC 50818 / BSB-021) TaxID=946362 RepID=F2UGZ3_SALR5|nr:uncharacterized protein PTSG_07515 [Salpingoeca rosetta]EGD76392.1 hypothetical protein PTSG_07515 [Salpingoeca rosetta]|eukprot:XP_004991307.1 hypothetical protein PTSG_07515 [Salpingoeca rosetta]
MAVTPTLYIADNKAGVISVWQLGQPSTLLAEWRTDAVGNDKEVVQDADGEAAREVEAEPAKPKEVTGVRVPRIAALADSSNKFAFAYGNTVHFYLIEHRSMTSSSSSNNRSSSNLLAIGTARGYMFVCDVANHKVLSKLKVSRNVPVKFGVFARRSSILFVNSVESVIKADDMVMCDHQRLLTVSSSVSRGRVALWALGPTLNRAMIPTEQFDLCHFRPTTDPRCRPDAIVPVVVPPATPPADAHKLADYDVTALPYLTSSAKHLDMAKKMMEGVVCVDFVEQPSMLTTATMRSKDVNVQTIVNFFVATARSTETRGDAGRMLSKPFLNIPRLGPAFTADVTLFTKHFPSIASAFLDSLGLVRTRVDAPAEVQLPSSRMIVTGANTLSINRNLWADMRESGELAKLQDANSAASLVEARVVPLPRAAGFVNDGPSLLETLVDTGDAELFGSFIVRAVIQYKWQTSGQRLFLWEAAWYMLSVALITALTFVFNTSGKDVAQLLGAADNSSNSNNGSDVVSVVIMVVLGVLAGVDMLQEVRQSRLVHGYWLDLWNWLDVTNVVLVFVVLGAYFAGWQHARAFLALAVYLRWYGLLYYLQPFQSTGPLVRMILAICFDMRYFLLVLGISIVAGWTSFRLLLRDDTTLLVEGLGDPANGLLLMFNMLLLADFELDTFDGDYVALLRILFVISMVLVPVVLLNLLIALMSDLYERIQDRADIEFQLLRARVLREQDAWLTQEEQMDARRFPMWLHVLVPKGSGVGRDGGSVQWQGVLHAVKKSRCREWGLLEWLM